MIGLLEPQHAQAVQRLAISRLQRQRLFVEFGGHLQPAGLMMPPSLRQTLLAPLRSA
jgi:hypothetical protein